MACNQKDNISQVVQCGGRITAELRVLAQGRPGKSAYEYAKEHGYTGTEEEFAQILADRADLKFVSDEFINNLFGFSTGGN